jgi:phosphomannomutase
MLSPLPTRDALIVILAILIMSREQQTPVSRLVASLPGRYTYSDRLKEFPTELGQARLSGIADSGEAEARQRVIEIFGDRFGEAAKIDATDGVRITFSSGDIVHLRPSGNAPELRCYTEADSPARAREVNAICLGIMEGWRS